MLICLKMNNKDFELHRLGWQAFQDLCVAIVEEQHNQPVQTFLPSNDAGRDGAFRGRWDRAVTGQSTIQCKFTSKKGERLTLSLLKDELPKAKRLASLGLADDYIIITNHTITGASELKIRQAFEATGVSCCRVFAHDWIVRRIAESSRLRMMMPRLYGIVDLQSILDDRAYRQAQLVLSQMGESLQKLVVTEAHRKSVRAVSEHNFVLLLGSPAAGKSTIGASLAIGALDAWSTPTIKSTSPAHLESHIDPDGGQFFWIDDAWGSTQYQKDLAEKWNQVFPLMQGAMHRGSKFLITSRDYIWTQAKTELKISALPVLQKSQVIIDVHELSLQEKARILYNHLKLGNQAPKFRSNIKPYLPKIAALDSFLPESARRIGSSFFTDGLKQNESEFLRFFTEPRDFLEQTIENLSLQCKAAIALIFLNGGVVRSPISDDDLEYSTNAFGVSKFSIRDELKNLNGSLVNLVSDEDGQFWTYYHPTISDAFAAFLAKSQELIEIYLRGAKPASLMSEVVCSGVNVQGAKVIVPANLLLMLAERLKGADKVRLKSFISNRSNRRFTEIILGLRPDLLAEFPYLVTPLHEDTDVDFLVTLFDQGLLSEEFRKRFYDAVEESIVDDADDSFLRHAGISRVLTDLERDGLNFEARYGVLENIDDYIDSRKDDWDADYDPQYHFEELQASLKNIARNMLSPDEVVSITRLIDDKISAAIDELQNRYEEPKTSSIPQQQTRATGDSLSELFRDLDE